MDQERGKTKSAKSFVRYLHITKLAQIDRDMLTGHELCGGEGRTKYKVSGNDPEQSLYLVHLEEEESAGYMTSQDPSWLHRTWCLVCT